ncbi:Rho-type GTPase-activating protein 1 [Hypsizygus marmoreus]|uniref:Rho-type GTPase-activating protein 1 n=1 Tax=Hypsizygus marmoreus TaxID=39966 RepID=A0A369JTM6_HYPMA|nr:Rho-type GTPase-activating protein 1 [Hypsizygus marmoreus]
MSKDQDHGRAASPWSNQHTYSPTEQPTDPDSSRFLPNQSQANAQSRLPYATTPSTNVSRLADRPNIPARAATLNSAEPDRNLSANTYVPQARSEELNHGSSSSSYPPAFPGSSPRPSPAFLSSAGGSRPSTPAGSTKPKHPSSSGHSDAIERPTSVASFSSVHSESSTSSRGKPPGTTASSTSASLTLTTCSACGKAMQGPFVRALGTVFHLNCFKCMDCGDVVASKFFPIDGPDGRQHPLCERDYFRRLNLICAKCNMALRGSYITACNKKFHVEHFTCSLCPTLFGPQDSYYEHEGDVYCHFHYSTRFATKCAGCNSAILKQFVEINRNMRDECWHPECYMINKFWNVKVVSRRPTSAASFEGEPEEPAYVEEEQRETPASLKEKQVRMEQQVYRIWTVLSAFEESSAACISDMLRQVSNGQYLDAIRMAEKFILHVEVLFATIDDLEYHFARLNQKGMSHVREARMLCRKTVELFTLLSHTQETGSRRMGMTQELLALVTGLAHYLKILIRIALTGALKLEREQSVREAMASFLDKLHLLAVQGGNPAARRMIKGQNGEFMTPSANGGNFGTQAVTYGFRSLAPENAGDSPFREGSSKVSSSNPPSDLCVKCNLTVEEDCVRLGTYQRWHSHCVQCAVCGKVAAMPVLKEPAPKNGDDSQVTIKDQPPKPSTARRPPANVGAFAYEVDSRRDSSSFGEVPTVILCTDHAHPGCRGGFQAVQRLEQYAFLLNVALRRLYLLLKKQGVVPLSPISSVHDQPYSPTDSDPYRNSTEIMRMKSVHLDRKLSATARLPKRSTIVESPAGRSVHPSDVLHTQRHHEHHATSHIAPNQQSQQGQLHHEPSHSHHNSPPPPQRPAPPYLQKLPTDNVNSQGQVLRPSFTRGYTERGNTEVMIVDDSAPNSPAEGNPTIPPLEDGITLADIPQLMEAAQAREQHRSLPRESLIPYIAELSALELAIVKHCAVLALSKSPLKDQFDLDELLEMVEPKKSGFWKTLFKGDKKNIKKKGVFGVPLDFLVEREGSDSMLGATPTNLRVPSFIDDVISAMKQMDMSVEGIFRKNGNIRRLKDLSEAIDRDPSSVDLTQDNPVQLAALLKKFLRELPDPLMTFKLHRLFVASQSLPQESDRHRYLHLISLIMPKSHRDTMEVLFVFLKWVASFAHMDAETGSKMDLGNLATVICPSILYARGRDALRDETFGAVRVVTALLEGQDEFFAVPEEFLAILNDQEYFANSLDLPGKEFMKKCETYMKLKGVNGRPQPGTPLNGPNNGGPPRYPIQNSTSGDRPGVMGPSMSDRNVRPPPPPSNASYQSASYPPPGSPSIPPPPQGSPQLQQLQQMQNQQMQQNQQNQHGQQNQWPQGDEWSGPPPPRPPPGGSSGSRPTSYQSPPNQQSHQR